MRKCLFQGSVSCYLDKPVIWEEIYELVFHLPCGCFQNRIPWFWVIRERVEYFIL